MLSHLLNYYQCISKCGLKRGIQGIEKRSARVLVTINCDFCWWKTIEMLDVLYIYDWGGVLTYQALLDLLEYYLHQSRRPRHILQFCGPWRQRSYGSKKSVTAKIQWQFIGPMQNIFTEFSLYCNKLKRMVLDYAKKKTVTQWKSSVGNKACRRFIH